jgi:hypothetical protein
MNRLISVLALLLLGASLPEVALPRNIPDAVRAAPGLRAELRLHARGSQIYACRQASPGAYGWQLVGPKAELFSSEAPKAGVVGEHFAGPTWRWGADGSEFVGAGPAAVKAPSPDDPARNIPWLLMPKKSGAGGRLGAFTHVQRVNTRGGVAPATGCDSQSVEASVNIPYEADYIFYAGG